MKRATLHHHAAQPCALPILSTVTLAYDDRHRRRIKMIADNGEPFLLDLKQATYLSDGDLLELEDGTSIKVVCALEEVLEVTCKRPVDMARISWHIGNRHMPIQIIEDAKLRLRYDHVLQDMIEGLGGKCVQKKATFSPEPGAYATMTSGRGHAEH